MFVVSLTFYDPHYIGATLRFYNLEMNELNSEQHLP